MQSTTDHIETLLSRVGDLAETKVELWKLKAAGKISETVSSLISIITIFILGATALIVLSVGAALWIGNQIGSLSSGFFIVGGFFTLTGLLVLLFRKHWIKTPLSNLIIDKIIKN